MRARSVCCAGVLQATLLDLRRAVGSTPRSGSRPARRSMHGPQSSPRGGLGAAARAGVWGPSMGGDGGGGCLSRSTLETRDRAAPPAAARPETCLRARNCPRPRCRSVLSGLARGGPVVEGGGGRAMAGAPSRRWRAPPPTRPPPRQQLNEALGHPACIFSAQAPALTGRRRSFRHAAAADASTHACATHTPLPPPQPRAPPLPGLTA